MKRISSSVIPDTTRGVLIKFWANTADDADVTVEDLYCERFPVLGWCVNLFSSTDRFGDVEDDCDPHISVEPIVSEPPSDWDVCVCCLEETTAGGTVWRFRDESSFDKGDFEAVRQEAAKQLTQCAQARRMRRAKLEKSGKPGTAARVIAANELAGQPERRN